MQCKMSNKVPPYIVHDTNAAHTHHFKPFQPFRQLKTDNLLVSVDTKKLPKSLVVGCRSYLVISVNQKLVQNG